MPVVYSLCKSSISRQVGLPADRLAGLLPFHCADADRDSSLKFTCGAEYHMSTLDTGCCALWDFQQVGRVGQVLSDLYRNAFIRQSRRTCGNTFFFVQHLTNTRAGRASCKTQVLSYRFTHVVISEGGNKMQKTTFGNTIKRGFEMNNE